MEAIAASLGQYAGAQFGSVEESPVGPRDRFLISTCEEAGIGHGSVQFGHRGVDGAEAARLLEKDERPFMFAHVPRDVARKTHCERVIRV